MKKVLLALLVAILAVCLVACGELDTPDTSAPGTTLKPKPTRPVETTTTPITTAPVVVDNERYHLTGLVTNNLVSGDLVFDIYDNGAAVVDYIGNADEVTVPAEIEGKKVTLIDDSAFANAKKVKKITLPDTVICFGKDAFYSCRELSEINLPTALTTVADRAFAYCEAITEMVLPDNIKIGEKLFYGCSALESVTLNVKEIPAETFAHCDSLTNYKIASDTTSIGDYAFYYCAAIDGLDIPASVTYIGKYAFANCASLTEIDLPSVITELPDYTFYGCLSLKSVDLSSVKSIGEFALGGCAAITEFVFSTELSEIKNGAFARCTSLVKINIPDSVKILPDAVFTNCTSLEEVTFASDLTAIGKSAFKNTLIKTMEIPETVTAIPTRLFEGCTSLETVILPDNGIASIASYAFMGCTSIKSVKIPSSTKNIGASAFEGCTALETVEIGSGVTRLSSKAFHNCMALTQINIPDNVTAIDANAVGYYDKTIVNEATGKEAIVLTVIDGMKIYGFTGGQAHAYASSNKIPFESVGLVGCVPYSDVVLEEIVDADGNKAYKIVEYTGTATRLSIPYEKDDIAIIEIADNFVKGNTNITEIKIPSSITKIGKSAFEGCTSVTKLELPTITVEIPEGGVDENGEPFVMPEIVIGEGAFAGLAIERLTLTSTMINLPARLFEGCANLKLITLSAYTESIGDKAFANTAVTSIEIPDTTVSIGNLILEGSPVETLKVPFIGPDADTAKTVAYFFGAASETLKKATVTNIAKAIAADAFRNCTALETIALGSGIASIGDYAFAGCTALVNPVTLASPAITVENGATIFEGTPSSTYLSVERKNAAAYKTAADEDGFMLWNGMFVSANTTDAVFNATIDGVVIKLTYAGKLTISGEGKIANYTLEALPVWSKVAVLIKEIDVKDITEIGSYAFYGCENLTKVTLADTVTVVGDSAFADCTSLATVTVAEGATVHANAFKGTPYAEAKAEEENKTEG